MMSELTKIEELRSEVKRQLLPGCGSVVNAYEIALKAVAIAESLTAELTALKSALSMAEVDEQFGGLSARLGFLPPSRTREECQSGIEKCYRITHRSIALREDVAKNLLEQMAIQTITINQIHSKFWEEKRKAENVVGLLKWVYSFASVRRILSEATTVKPWRDNARSILEIVDPGKRCEKCGDKMDGHEDESGTRCRWCVTCGDSSSGDSVCVVP